MSDDLSQSGVEKQTVICGQKEELGHLRALCGREFQAGVGGGGRQESGGVAARPTPGREEGGALSSSGE